MDWYFWFRLLTCIDSLHSLHSTSVPAACVSCTASKLQWMSQLLIDRDYLGDVPDNQRVAWGQDLGLSINGTLTAMQQMKVPITVDVKLVGFAGDG